MGGPFLFLHTEPIHLDSVMLPGTVPLIMYLLVDDRWLAQSLCGISLFILYDVDPPSHFNIRHVNAQRMLSVCKSSQQIFKRDYVYDWRKTLNHSNHYKNKKLFRYFCEVLLKAEFYLMINFFNKHTYRTAVFRLTKCCILF